ncbi:MAG: glycosyltransferase family 4 protein [Sphingobacteriales bacterium]|nr:glycosyltransferase family 4 protein [Sphingobacteriales bacterium]
MSKKVLFMVPYPFDKAPSQRLKFEQYYPYFEQNGFIIKHRAFISEAFWEVIYRKGHWFSKLRYTLAGYLKRITDLFRIRQYEVVYIHLWATPFGFPVYEWLVCLLARRVIYDIDDLVYLADSKSQVNKMVAGLKGRNKPVFLMKKADHVITCTPYLDNFVRKYNNRTTDISSTINTDTYRPKKEYDFREPLPVLGWSGSHSTSKYLHLLEPVFRQLKKEGVLFKLLVMGDAGFTIDGMEVEALPWKEEYETAVISRFDIGLYPLPDEQWVYGKSGLKALQYMAAGVPTIATAIGANFRIMEEGRTGFLARSADDWVRIIKQLLSSPTLRERTGTAAAEFVQQHFSVEANKDTYLSILQGNQESRNN